MTDREWYESWFDSPLYEKLYAHRDEAEAERLVDWIVQKASPRNYPEIVDMGCGRGRHALLLARRGYRVTGVDLSEQAIARARLLAAGKDLPVRFEIGDMRTWQSGPFNMVCSLFTSFGYFSADSENIETLKNITGQIKRGGYLVLDYLNPVWVTRELVPLETLALDEMVCRVTRSVEQNTIVKNISFFKDPQSDPLSFREQVKLYGQQWFSESLHLCGCSELSFFGDYSGSAFDPQKSPRQLILARF